LDDNFSKLNVNTTSIYDSMITISTSFVVVDKQGDSRVADNGGLNKG
jgi:hypothetical protein